MDLQVIQNKIFEVRGCRVMLDFHLAELYQVETWALKQAVKRNIGRFPSDFMFVLSKEEANLLLSIGVSQNVIPPDYNFGVALPMAFTEQGVAMLSSVLRSQTAIEVNISIMRAFVLMRQMVAGYEELLKRIEELEASTDTQFNDLSGIDPAFEPVPRAEATPQNRIRYLWRTGNRQVTVSVTKCFLIDCIPINSIHSSCGQPTGLPAFLISFSSGTFPETPAVRGMADCFSWKEPSETRTSVSKDGLPTPLPFPPTIL